MKVVILAGGRGTRLSEETEVVPKPMVDIGGRPLLWHVMHCYADQGFDEFVIALGYKGDVIKRYFVEAVALAGDITVSLGDGLVHPRRAAREKWTVHLVETGVDSNTGGRVRRIADLLADETFMLTYGDGVADVNLTRLLDHHREHGRLATVTAVRPPARFGALDIAEDGSARMTEKPQTGEGWINGGFMAIDPQILSRIRGDDSNLETDVLEPLSHDGQLTAFRHEGFWQPVDTLRDLRILRSLWETGHPPWMST